MKKLFTKENIISSSHRYLLICKQRELNGWQKTSRHMDGRREMKNVRHKNNLTNNLIYGVTVKCSAQKSVGRETNGKMFGTKIIHQMDAQ